MFCLTVLTWDGYPEPKIETREGKRVETYPNARKPEWPEAEFIVGNPPFIGGKDIRATFGDSYTETLWRVHKDINDSADFRPLCPTRWRLTVRKKLKLEESMMAKDNGEQGNAITRDRLADLLNEDLAREYQAIIAYTVYSQVLKGAAYMSIADQLQKHAKEELKHALIISRQVDYLGKMPPVVWR